eukprot:4250505-Karenia_brevis.AAC.1
MSKEDIFPLEGQNRFVCMQIELFVAQFSEWGKAVQYCRQPATWLVHVSKCGRDKLEIKALAYFDYKDKKWGMISDLKK